MEAAVKSAVVPGFNLFSYKGEKRNGKSIQLFSWTGSTYLKNSHHL